MDGPEVFRRIMKRIVVGVSLSLGKAEILRINRLSNTNTKPNTNCTTIIPPLQKASEERALRYHIQNLCTKLTKSNKRSMKGKIFYHPSHSTYASYPFYCCSPMTAVNGISPFPESESKQKNSILTVSFH
jgi:hypothetical protein